MGATRWGKGSEFFLRWFNEPFPEFLQQNQSLRQKKKWLGKCEPHFSLGALYDVQCQGLPPPLGRSSDQFHPVLKGQAVSNDMSYRKLRLNIIDISATPWSQNMAKTKGSQWTRYFPWQLLNKSYQVLLLVISLGLSWTRNLTKMYLSKSLPEMVNPGKVLVSMWWQGYPK